MLAEPTDSSSPITENSSTKEKTNELFIFFRDLFVILAIVLIIRSFVASPFRISGNSMDESYFDKEFIVVDKFSYADFGLFRIGDPERGDVVILRPHAANGKEYYIKRVIGLPGDRIEFKDGEVFITPANSSGAIKLSEGYLSAFNKGRTFLPNDVRTSVFIVPEQEYFVMGDNRNNSSDSRSCFRTCLSGEVGHYLKRSDIIGKVYMDLGYFRVFNTFSLTPIRITLAERAEWILKPRFLNTPRTWHYPEISTK